MCFAHRSVSLQAQFIGLRTIRINHRASEYLCLWVTVENPTLMLDYFMLNVPVFPHTIIDNNSRNSCVRIRAVYMLCRFSRVVYSACEQPLCGAFLFLFCVTRNRRFIGVALQARRVCAGRSHAPSRSSFKISGTFHLEVAENASPGLVRASCRLRRLSSRRPCDSRQGDGALSSQSSPQL